MNKEQRINAIFITLKHCFLATTDQLETFFSEFGSPKKRCSECLKELEEDGLIEGQKQRRFGHAKMWRLTYKGKLKVGLTKRNISFEHIHAKHFLKITQCFIEIWKNGGLEFFQCEYRQDFVSNDIFYKFSPDGIFRVFGKSYILEVQRSPLSKTRWGNKWKVHEEFHRSFSEIKVDNIVFSNPVTFILTTQFEDNVRANTDINLKIVRDVKEIIDFINQHK